ncbi:MAG: ferric reductase-like transmembrane domain-containing protein [Ilumatobacteraceae bacterium]
MIALTQSLAVWYATRGSGAVSLVLLTASFALGTPTLLSWGSERFPRLVVQLLHRNVSLLVVVFLAIHVSTTVIDGFAPIGWLDVIVPFRSGYRPIWLGLGAVAVDLLLAIIITSLLRVRIGYARWRQIHLLSYAMWPIALVHGLGTGSDTRSPWMWWLAGLCSLVVLASVASRLIARRPADPHARTLAVSTALVLPVLVLGWLLVGPMKPTWGKKHVTNVPVVTLDPALDSVPGS